MVNSHIACDPTIRQPGSDLPRQQWSLLNRFRTEQGHCGAGRRKWQLTDTDLCPCGETQTMSHTVESCPLTKLNGGLSRLHSADEDAVSWLTNYGKWHAYEKKNGFVSSDLEWPLTKISRSRGYHRCPRPIVCAAHVRPVCDSQVLVFIYRTIIPVQYFSTSDVDTFICPFVHITFACRDDADTENIYNRCRTNAAAEASYDRARSLAVYTRSHIAY